MDNLDPFEEGEFDHVFYEMVAEVVVPLYRAFKAQGVSGQEAAALAAAFAQQMIPTDTKGPQDGS